MAGLTLVALPASLFIGCGVGAGGRMRWLVVGALVFFVACPVTVRIAVQGRNGDVPSDHAVDGMLGAWVFLALAVLVTFGVGAAIGAAFHRSRARVVAALVALVLLAGPAVLVAGGVSLIVADAMQCPPDAHECPI